MNRLRMGQVRFTLILILTALLSAHAALGMSSKREWFIEGTEQKAIRPQSAQAWPKINYPATDMIIAMDPDIPADLQKVFFDSSSADPVFRLVLDEAVLGSAPSSAWMPIVGKHILTLVDEVGIIGDSLTFEVR